MGAVSSWLKRWSPWVAPSSSVNEDVAPTLCSKALNFADWALGIRQSPVPAARLNGGYQKLIKARPRSGTLQAKIRRHLRQKYCQLLNLRRHFEVAIAIL